MVAIVIINSLFYWKNTLHFYCNIKEYNIQKMWVIHKLLNILRLAVYNQSFFQIYSIRLLSLGGHQQRCMRRRYAVVTNTPWGRSKRALSASESEAGIDMILPPKCQYYRPNYITKLWPRFRTKYFL